MTEAGDQSNVIDYFGKGRPLEAKPKLHVDLERAVAKLQGMFANDMAGYVVFAVDHKGKWSLGWAVDADPDCPVGPRMMMGLAAEAFREELVTDIAVRDILNEPA